MADTNAAAAPTGKQLNYLRTLAKRTGTTFTPPKNRRQASAEIRRLKKIAATGFTFAELQGEQAAQHANDDTPLPTDLATAIRPNEISGYGASGTWKGRS